MYVLFMILLSHDIVFNIFASDHNGHYVIMPAGAGFVHTQQACHTPHQGHRHIFNMSHGDRGGQMPPLDFLRRGGAPLKKELSPPSAPAQFENFDLHPPPMHVWELADHIE